MRINSGLPIQSQVEVERTQKKPAGSANEKSPSGVTSQFSQDVVRLSSLVDQADAAPDIREEKVNALRASISSGTYSVSPEALADSILRDVVGR